MEAGRPHDIRPIAPCEARRIEAGIFNYGSDMTIANNPFEVMGLERLVESQAADYIGKAALEEIQASEASAASSSASRSTAMRSRSRSPRSVPRCTTVESVGALTDLIWSPRLERNIGYVWVPIELGCPRYPARDPGPQRR